MSAESRCVCFKDDEGQYRFRLVAANGEPIAQSEGYEAKQSVRELHSRYFWAFKWDDETGEADD